jgi:hypothetical protein
MADIPPILEALEKADIPAWAVPYVYHHLRQSPARVILNVFDVEQTGEAHIKQLDVDIECQVSVCEAADEACGTFRLAFQLQAELNLETPEAPLDYGFSSEGPVGSFSPDLLYSWVLDEDDAVQHGLIDPDATLADIAGLIKQATVQLVPFNMEEAIEYQASGPVGKYGLYATCRVPRSNQPDLLFDGTLLHEVFTQVSEKKQIRLSLFHSRHAGYVAHRETITLVKKPKGSRMWAADSTSEGFSNHEAVIGKSPAEIIEKLGFGDAEKALYEMAHWETAERI